MMGKISNVIFLTNAIVDLSLYLYFAKNLATQMKKLIFSLLVFCFMMACQSQTNLPSYGVLSLQDFKTVIKEHKDLILIDVRTPGEFANGKIDGAINIDVQSPDFIDQLNLLNKDLEYGVYCALGRRSAIAADQMKKLGLTKIYDLGGGYNAWIKEEKK
ncbi:MAG: rhodanese-like domain-containing protein [Saprospiraceae bacterium]|nr:rhodanese-like domain-containing protein [Saprospiraceae bacterium]